MATTSFLSSRTTHPASPFTRSSVMDAEAHVAPPSPMHMAWDVRIGLIYEWPLLCEYIVTRLHEAAVITIEC